MTKTVEEARKVIHQRVIRWLNRFNANDLYEQGLSLDEALNALITTVRAEERVRIVKALRAENQRRDDGESVGSYAAWAAAADFVEALPEENDINKEAE